jgi:hypothetical protein
MKGVKRFGMIGKLAPCYIRPFPILERCRTVAYKRVDVVMLEVTPLEVDLTYPEHLIKILDQKSYVMRRKKIKFLKVQWSNHTEEEAT